MRLPAPTSSRALGGALLAVAGCVLLAALPVPAVAGSTSALETSARPRLPKGVGDPYFPHYGNRGYDVRHYDVADRFDPRSGKLSGRTKITAVATADRKRISLDLVLTPLAVRVDGTRATFHQVRGRKVVVRPKHRLAVGDTFRVKVRYRGVPERIVRGDLAPWFSGGGEAMAIGEPEICAWWFACNDHPRDKATYDISLRVPKGRQAISNGVLLSRTTASGHTTWRWRMAQPMASYLAFFAVGRFRVERTSAGGLPVLYAVSKRLTRGEQKTELRLLRRTPEVVQWLADRFGPYPFQAMGGVITSLYTGFALENQSRPVYPYLGDNGEGRSIVVHELAHQWFGDSVSVEDWRDIWLNEGFATYAEWLYRAGHGGRSVAQQLQDAYDSRPASHQFWRLKIGNPGGKQVFAIPVYDRGAMTLAALANRIGADNLATVLREWVAKHRYGNADIAEFVALAQAESGQDLRSFFTAWLYTAGKPAATAANGLA
jgi:aminopeptidase N